MPLSRRSFWSSFQPWPRSGMLNVSARDASILPRAAHRPAVVASTVIILLDHGGCSHGDSVWRRLNLFPAPEVLTLDQEVSTVTCFFSAQS